MLALFLLLVPDVGTAFMRILLGVACSGLMYAIVRKLWDRVRTYLKVLTVASLFIVLCLAVGIYFVRYATSDILKMVGLALCSGSVVAAVFLVGAMLTVALEGYLQQQVKRRNARGLVMMHLAELITETADPVKNYGAYWRWKLEKSASLLEREVPRQVLTFDARTDLWVASRCAGASEGLRHIKVHLLSPIGRSSEQLSRLLKHQLTALATDNWRNMIYRKPPAKPAKSRKETLVSVVRFAAVALLPAVSVFVVAPWLNFGGDSLTWAKIATFGWAVLSVLFALDPTIREKVVAAGDIVSAVRGADDKSRRDGERGPTNSDS